MPETERCQKCGSPLSKSAPEGLCPACLLRAAAEDALPAEPGAIGSDAPTEVAVSSEGGMQFGSYRVIAVLGEGGMGIVSLGLQEHPIQRRVAIKVIKRGIDSREILGRFESERQILALLNHPGIAQIYEAGTTPEHQPYFVMEYVQGIPITEYCDRNLLAGVYKI